MDLRENLKRAALALSEADALLVTAGAGMGVDSGLPTSGATRGSGRPTRPWPNWGSPSWKWPTPSGSTGIRPGVGFYGHRLNLYRRTVPHGGFKRLLELCKKKKEGYFVFTSNVDGQFQIAGFDEDRIEECHGSLHHLQCLRPCSQDIWEAREVTPTSTRRSSGPGSPCRAARDAGPSPAPMSSCSTTGTGSRIAPRARATASTDGSRDSPAAGQHSPWWRWAPARPWRPSGWPPRQPPGAEGHPDPDQSPRLRRPRRPHRHPVRCRGGDPQYPRTAGA